MTVMQFLMPLTFTGISVGICKNSSYGISELEIWCITWSGHTVSMWMKEAAWIFAKALVVN